MIRSSMYPNYLIPLLCVGVFINSRPPAAVAAAAATAPPVRFTITHGNAWAAVMGNGGGGAGSEVSVGALPLELPADPLDPAYLEQYLAVKALWDSR